MLGELHEARHARVMALLKAQGARSVVDLGCGSGLLLSRMAAEPDFIRLVGVEQEADGLAMARRLVEESGQGDKVSFVAGSYQNAGLALTGFDAALMIETLEHNPPDRLDQVATTVFQHFRPRQVILTTPNVEYNPLYGLAPDELRESDHYFEWSRTRFRQWCRRVAERFGYQVTISGIGAEDPDLGPPTQLANFWRIEE
jgi:small RNA 2'-O-methyltransferase